MRAPAVVLGTPNWITPPAELEEEFFPSAASILDAVHTRLTPLQGYRPTGPARDRNRLMATGR